MNRDKSASFARANACRSVPNFFLLVIGIVSVAASVARAQETLASDALPVNTVIANVKVGKAPQGVVVSPDNNSVYVANAFSNTVSIINAQTNTVENTISAGTSPFSLAISSDGSTLYVSQYASTGAVTVIDLANGNSIKTITGISPYPFGIALSPDGTQLWVAAGDIDRIDTASNNLLSPVTVPSGCQALAFTPDGKKVYASGRYTGNITVVSTATEQVTKTIPISPKLFSLEFGAIAMKGQYAYVLVDVGQNNLHGWLVTINTTTDTVVKTDKWLFEAGDLPALLPNTPYLYISNFGSRKVTLFDTRTKTLVGDSVTVGDSPYDIAIAPNGTRAYVTEEFSNKVTVIKIH